MTLKQPWNSSQRSGWCWLSQHLVSVHSSTDGHCNINYPTRLFYASLFYLCFKWADRVTGQQRSRACSWVVTDGIKILPKMIYSRIPFLGHISTRATALYLQRLFERWRSDASEQFINAADTQLQPDISFSLLFKIQSSPTALSSTYRRETSEWFFSISTDSPKQQCNEMEGNSRRKSVL